MDLDNLTKEELVEMLIKSKKWNKINLWTRLVGNVILFIILLIGIISLW